MPAAPFARVRDAPADASGRWSFAGVGFTDGEGWIEVGGREVPVQPVPLKLLRVLLAAAPRVVPREELVRSVWGRAPQLVSRNVVSNAVARLREALGDGAARHLVAVSGVGYGWRGAVEFAPADARAADRAEATEPPEAAAERFMSRLWLDVLRGRSAGHARMTLHEAVQAGIGRAEADLAGEPLVLACIYRTLAAHRRLQHDAVGAIDHLRRARALAAGPAGPAQPDVALEIHFELCCALAYSVVWDGGAARLRLARQEVAAARAALRASPQAGPGVRLAAARADFVLAFYEQDWTRALAGSQALVAATDAQPAPDPRRRWECRVHHAAILLRAGHDDAAVDAIERPFGDGPAPPLDASDIIALQARMTRGAIYACVGRHADAVAHLEPLQAELAAAGLGSSGVGPETASWLAGSLLHVGRAGEALALASAAHADAEARFGASSEAALQALPTLSRTLVAAGREAEALRRLEEGVGSHVDRIAMPGQRYAVLALAEWIDLLFRHGDARRAEALQRTLRPRDLRAAALRPADAQACFERWAQARAAAAAPEKPAPASRRRAGHSPGDAAPAAAGSA